MKRAIGYCRVSSEKQVDNYSLETQEQGIKTWCRRNDLDLVRIFREEGKSARTLDREELQKLRRHCQRSRVDVVVVYKVSRIARDTFDYLYLKKWLLQRGITLRSVLEHFDDSPHGALLETVLASFAQFDNDVRSEQILSGMKAAAKEGRWVWRAPVGYLNNGQAKVGPSLVPDREPRRRDPHGVRAGSDRAALATRDRRRAESAGIPDGDANRRFSGAVGGQPAAESGCTAAGWSIAKWEFDRAGRLAASRGTGAAVAARRRPASQTPVDGTRRRGQRNSPDFPLRGMVLCAQTGGKRQRQLQQGHATDGAYAYYHTQKVKPCAARHARSAARRSWRSCWTSCGRSPSCWTLWQSRCEGRRAQRARGQGTPRERERAHRSGWRSSRQGQESGWSARSPSTPRSTRPRSTSWRRSWTTEIGDDRGACSRVSAGPKSGHRRRGRPGEGRAG